MEPKTSTEITDPTYSVARWDECYENNRTRTMVVMQWIPVPNSHDGDGYIELVSRRNGAAYLGAWLAILQVASKCSVRGTLIRRNGKPHTAKSIAKITRIDEKIITDTLQILVSEDVAWLCHEGRTLPAPSPHPTDEEGMKEEKEVALTLSEYLIESETKAGGRKLTAKPPSGVKPILALLNDGVTATEVRETIDWLCGTNKLSDYPFAVQSGKSLREKWDKIQAAMAKSKPKQSLIKANKEGVLNRPW